VSGLAERDGRKQLSEEEDARRAGEARRLAAELGHLPIAIDHAAAYLAETEVSVDEYSPDSRRTLTSYSASSPGIRICLPTSRYLGDVNNAPYS